MNKWSTRNIAAGGEFYNMQYPALRNKRPLIPVMEASMWMYTSTWDKTRARQAETLSLVLGKLEPSKW